jgi:hypothetical protein
MSDSVDRIKKNLEARYLKPADKNRESDEAVISLYRSLRKDEVGELVDFAFELHQSERSGPTENILCRLVTFNPGCLRNFIGRFVDHNLYYPAFIFYGADAESANRIVRAMGKGGALTVDHMLCALAWIGDKTVQEALASWRRSPPAWVDALHVPPHVYAQQAGWELTKTGGRRDLFLQECHPLIKPGNDYAVMDVLTVNVPHDNSCRWCNQQMTSLLTLDLTNPALRFLGFDGQHLRITTCETCTGYGVVFTKADLSGNAEWHDANAKPSYLPNETESWIRMPEAPLVFSSQPRHWIESADWCFAAGPSSQLGGHPTWVQNAEYPRCPNCQELMPFLAQLDRTDVEEYGEGIYYMFFCKECGVAATSYQQS